MRQAEQNVFVGISLANKTFTGAEVTAALDAAIKNFQARKIVFLVADDIELINRRVFEPASNRRQRSEIAVRSKEIETTIWEAVPCELVRSGKVVVKRWKSILNPSYFQTFFALNDLFIQDPLFRSDVFNLARLYADRRGRKVDQAQCHYLCQYVLAELPTFIEGVQIEGKNYLSMVYPAIGEETVDTIVDGIFEGKYSTEFRARSRCNLVKVDGLRQKTDI